VLNATVASLWLGRRVWLLTSALVVALAFLACDTRMRVEKIEALTRERMTQFPEPAPDRGSSSGYELGQHRLVLPSLGTDGYHWILQTERIFAEGGLRLREIDYDNAPNGRETHWASPFRWWVTSLVSLRTLADADLGLPRALERVAPWVNTILLGLLLIGATLLLAWRFGSLSAATFAIGCVTVYPFYEYFVAGYLDHHGLAAFASVLSVTLIAAGGGGLVEPAEVQARRGDGPVVKRTPRVPESARAAHAWAAGSAAAAAVAIWVSAATAVPVLVGISLAAMSHSTVLPGESSRLEPSVWRTWGVVGGVLSVLVYAIEYLPGHAGIRLEVNHPLYGLAWVAAGDFLFRLVRLRDTPGRSLGAAAGEGLRRGDRLWIAVDLLGILLLPAVVLLSSGSTFTLFDPFLWSLHERFIVEFLSLRRHLAFMSPGEIIAGVSVVPLALLPAAALLRKDAVRRGRLGFEVLESLIIGAVSFTFLLTVTWGLLAATFRTMDLELGSFSNLVALFVALVVSVPVVLGFRVWIASVSEAPLTPGARAQLAFTAIPGALLLTLSVGQVRWLGIASALCLVLVAVMVSVMGAGSVVWPRPSRVAAVSALALTFLPYPAFVLRLASTVEGPGYLLQDVQQLATRDVSHWLRARVGGEDAVILGGPTETTRMIYFGGFRGIGTLYWENVEGLRRAAAIASAATAEETRALTRSSGVTHIVLFSWDTGLSDLRAAAGQGSADAAPESFLESVTAELRLARTDGLPAWLNPLPYPLPQVGPLRGSNVIILEVVEDQPREIHLVRLAQFLRASGAANLAEQALGASLSARPNLPALALLAQLRQLRGDSVGFSGAIDGIHRLLDQAVEMELVDQVNLVIALGLAGDIPELSSQLRGALDAADEREIRRLSPDALVMMIGLSRQLGLDRGRESLLEFAFSLLPDSEKAALSR
jgi:hypothetical protein